MFREGYVLAILKDENGKTYGAKIYSNNKVLGYTNSEILQLKRNGIQLINAIITNDGFVRAREGKLPVEVVPNRPNIQMQRDMSQARKIIKTSTKVMVYHGNKDKSMVPIYGRGQQDTDYGQGFYTTPNKKLAKEWAWAYYSSGDRGYVHSYKVDLSGLYVVDFTRLHTINWIAELITHRKVEEKSNSRIIQRINRIKQNFKVNTDCDIIIGYRCDDRYYNTINNFMLGLQTIEEIDRIFRLGDLGLQVFFKSKNAFDRLCVAEHIVEEVPKSYYNKFYNRESTVKKEMRKQASETVNGHYIDDVFSMYLGV